MKIGTFCQTLILAGKNDEQILKAVSKKFPEAKTSKKCIAWYKNDMRKKGLLPKIIRNGVPKKGKLETMPLCA